MIFSINKLKLNEQLVLLFPGEPAPDDSKELVKKKNCMLFKLTNGWHGDNCHNAKGHDGFICQYEQ